MVIETACFATGLVMNMVLNMTASTDKKQNKKNTKHCHRNYKCCIEVLNTLRLVLLAGTNFSVLVVCCIWQVFILAFLR